jgi:hypothetical protein
VLRIREVFLAGTTWYARVVMDDDVEKIVIRDQLRICEPELLLNFYERLMEDKRK